MKKHSNHKKEGIDAVPQGAVLNGAYSKFWKVRSFSAVGITCGTLFSMIHFVSGHATAGPLEITLVTLAAVNLVAFRYHKHADWSSWAVLSIMIVLLMFLLVDGSFGGMGVLWFALFPPLAFFMEGVWSGALWAGFVLVLLLLSSWVSAGSLFNFYYTPLQIGLVAMMYTALSLVIFAFEWIVEKTHAALLEEHRRADQLNRRFEEALHNSKALYESEAKSVKELQDTKRAILNLLEDIEENRKNATEASRRNEAILTSIADAVAVTDKEGKIIFVNPAFEKMLGWKQDEILNKKYVDVVPSEDLMGMRVAETHRMITFVLSRDFPKKLGSCELKDHSYVRRDGTIFPVEGLVTPLRMEDVVTGTVSVFRDVTHLKEIEKMRTDFLTLTSHQLRTPLSGTKWLIETLKRGVLGKLNTKQLSYLTDIYQSNERMIKLVVDMLNTLRLESGNVVLNRVPIPAHQIFKQVLETLEPAARSRGVEIVYEQRPADDTVLSTDPKIVETIVESFASNAVNYTTPDNQRSVILAGHAEPNSYVFTVTDHGIGIPKEEQRKIFDRFYRASNAKAYKPDGTGLGLYIAKMLAEKLGGSVSFVSKEGEGSTFSTRIPL